MTFLDPPVISSPTFPWAWMPQRKARTRKEKQMTITDPCQVSREYLQDKAEAFTRKAAELRAQADRYDAMAAEFTERATVAPSKTSA